MEQMRIDELAKRLLEGLPSSIRELQGDIEKNFRAVLRANLGRLDLVARDEFDAQSKVLARTRSRLEALEVRVAALEADQARTDSDAGSGAGGGEGGERPG